MVRFIALAAVAGIGAYFVLGGTTGYSRTVDRSPREVVTALADLDITDQPGSPGTDPSRSGGVRPIFRRETTDGAVVWKIMSGNDVAMTMTAQLIPVEGGKKTKVVGSVERGNSPDDFTSPAFRSEGITMGLFAMALDDELNELTRVMTSSAGTCRELLSQFERSNMANADLHHRGGLADGIGDVSKLAIKMQAYQAEARRLGCEEYFGAGGFSAEPRPEPEGWDEPGEPVDGGWGNP